MTGKTAGVLTILVKTIVNAIIPILLRQYFLLFITSSNVHFVRGHLLITLIEWLLSRKWQNHY